MAHFDSNANPNKPLLDEINGAEAWFWAKKKRPVWAKRAVRRGAIETLEGSARVNKGDFVCRGELGEFWPQPPAEFLVKYDATKIVDSDGFRMYLPNRSAPGVLAAQVHDAFVVQTNHGVLKGQPGDFLVKAYQDRDVLYPDALHIVAAEVFHRTYRIVRDEKRS